MLAVETLHLVDDGTLQAELGRLCDLHVDSIRQAVPIYSELVSRGVDLSYLPSQFLNALKLAASGRLEPEAVLAFGKSREKSEIVAQLPASEQRRLASGARVAVVRARAGRVTEDEIPATRLTASELSGIVRDGKVLSAKDQKRIIAQAPYPIDTTPPARILTLRLSAEVFDALLRASARARRTPEFVAASIIQSALEKSSDEQVA